jgi:hypothetical protein
MVAHDPDLARLARALASHMDGFTARAVDDFGYRVRLDHPDGRSLHLHRHYKDGSRVELAGIYPHSDYYFRNGEHVSITVAIARGPAVIAREITRRLLPTSTEVLGKVQAHIAKQADDQTNRARAAERLAALIPIEHPRRRQPRHDYPLVCGRRTDRLRPHRPERRRDQRHLRSAQPVHRFSRAARRRPRRRWPAASPRRR